MEQLPTIFPVNIWRTYLFEIERRWAKWLISDPSPKGTRWVNDPSLDHADQWSDEFLSRVDLIDHWSENGFVRKERHRSEIQIRLLPKERTLSTLILSGYSKKLKISYCKTRFYAMNIKVTFPLIPTHNFWKNFLSYKLRCYTGISGLRKAVTTYVKKFRIFSRVLI